MLSSEQESMLRPDARRALAHAAQLAHGAGRHEVIREDLFRGLTADRSSNAALVFDSVGWEINGNAEGLAKTGGHRDAAYSAHATDAIDAARNSARNGGQRYVGSEHLLLGLVLQPHPALAEEMVHRDVSVDMLERAAERAGRWDESPRYSPEALEVLWDAEAVARDSGRLMLAVADLFAALADCRCDDLAAIFRDGRFDPSSLRRELGRTGGVPESGTSFVTDSERLTRALHVSDQCRRDVGADRVAPHDLLLGALAVRDLWTEKQIAAAKTSPEELRAMLPNIAAGSIRARTPGWEGFSDVSHRVLRGAARAARAAGADVVGAVDVVRAALAVAPADLTARLVSAGLRPGEPLEVPAAGRSSGRDSSLPFSEELVRGLGNARISWLDQDAVRASPLHLLLGLFGLNGDAVREWMERWRLSPFEAEEVVLAYALADSWATEAQQVWTDAIALAIHHGAPVLGVVHIASVLIDRSDAAEQQLLIAKGITRKRFDGLVAAIVSTGPDPTARHDASRRALPCDAACEQLRTAAVSRAAAAGRLRVARVDLVGALTSGAFDSLGWGGGLAPRASVTPAGPAPVRQQPSRRASSRKDHRPLSSPAWSLVALRRELGDVARVYSWWHRRRLQTDGAFTFGGRHGGLAEFDELLLQSDKAVAEASDGTDWELAEAWLGRAEILEAIGRVAEAGADRDAVNALISEDDEASSHLWMRAQVSLADIHDELDALADEPDPVAVHEARSGLLGIQALVWLDFWFPGLGRDPRWGASRHAVSTLLPRSANAASLLRAGAIGTALREMRRIVRGRRRFQLARHPEALSAEVLLAHARLVAAARSERSFLSHRWRLARARRHIGYLSFAHRRWLESGHPRTLKVDGFVVDVLMASGRSADALDAAVSAIAEADAARYRFDDTRTRESWRALYTGLMQRAVDLAQRADDECLVVDLIEAARSQGAPIAAAERDRHQRPLGHQYLAPAATHMDRDQISASLALIADVPVAATAHVSVTAGRSRLDLVDGVDTDSRPPDLATLARDITGHPDTWLWGSWDLGDVVMSYVVRPGLEAGAPAIDIAATPRISNGEPTALGRALGDFSAAMMTEAQQAGGPTGIQSFLETSRMFASTGAERELLSNLGMELIPEVLRHEVARRVAGGLEPLSLVVMPAPSCASLPLAALAVAIPHDSTFPRSDATRLVEGARLFMVPGAQFAVAARRRHHANWSALGANRTNTAIVADQPGTGNCLRHAKRSVPDGTVTLASGPAATLSTTIDALSGGRPGSPGVLQFVGHARPGTAGLPSDAHLILHNGFDDPAERLYARDLLRGRFPNLGLPQTVVLSACSTWGDEGAADWLGLSTGFVWCGAMNVVATLWPILDIDDRDAGDAPPELLRPDKELVQQLAVGAKLPVDVIREFQLDRLRDQRAAAWIDEEWRYELADLAPAAHSYLWGGFAVISVANGLTATHPATDPVTAGVLPNDLLQRASPPATDVTINRERSAPAARATQTPSPPARVRSGARDRRAVVRLEFGPGSDETRSRIKDRCGFIVRGNGIERSVETHHAPMHAAFVRVTEAREAVTRRDLAIDITESKRVYPSWTGRFFYRIQSYGQILIDDTGVRAMIADPDTIDGIEVRPRLIAGIAVDFRDIAAVEVQYVERDRASQTDELRAVRQRPARVDPKQPALLILRGHGRDGRRPFTVEMELDELGGRRTDTRLKAANDCIQHIGVTWARSQLQRNDLTPDEKARVRRFAEGQWEHVVTWMRQRDTGVVEVGHEVDWVHTEWLYAGLVPPPNGTLGFGVPEESHENPALSHAADQELFAASTLDVLTVAASRCADRPIGTFDILTAILDADARGDWEAVQLHTTYVARNYPERYTDDHPGESTWNGVPVSADAAAALAIAALISDTYDLRPMPPAVLGLGLVWDARSGASRALLEGSAADHASLLRVIQDDVLGVDLQSLIDALPRPE